MKLNTSPLDIGRGKRVIQKETGSYSLRAVAPDHKEIEKLSYRGRYISINDIESKLKVGRLVESSRRYLWN